ncbi:CRISPR-associated endonuclease Cas2 [Microgenomates group bacterium]|nr:CRISPR-associated endonuclease Cas2 [Microgenomates group bacterium]
MGKFTEESRKRKIEDLSWGLVSHMNDLVLLSLFLGLSLAMPSKRTGKFLSQIFKKLHQSLNQDKIRNTFYQLKQKGLIDYSKRLWNQPQITRQGQKRLQSILPEYQAERTWDDRLYLISYDIPENKKTDRDNLRKLLKNLGCGLLQESVWLTPYNPKTILKNYVKKNDLAGLVLVSDLGKDSSIGEEDNLSLINRVYQLDDLNLRYQEFIEQWSQKKPSQEMISHFFSILKDDPQLPFELLPDNWLGEKAWESVKSIFSQSGSVAKI